MFPAQLVLYRGKSPSVPVGEKKRRFCNVDKNFKTPSARETRFISLLLFSRSRGLGFERERESSTIDHILRYNGGIISPRERKGETEREREWHRWYGHIGREECEEEPLRDREVDQGNYGKLGKEEKSESERASERERERASERERERARARARETERARASASTVIPTWKKPVFLTHASAISMSRSMTTAVRLRETRAMSK